MKTPINSGTAIGLVVAAAFFYSERGLAGDCFVELFDKANFQGSQLRIEGPAELADLSRLKGENWSDRIESLRVGKNAELTAFRNAGFEAEPEAPLNHPHALKAWGATEKDIAAYQDLELTVGAGREEHHLGELKFHRNINSLKLRCLR